MWRVTSASIRRSVRHLPQATASPAAPFPYAHSSAAATPATRSDLRDSSPCPLQPSPHEFDDNRTHASDSSQIISIVGASRWFRIAGGYAGSGMGTGGVRWRSAISGAGGGGDDGSETDGQGGELPPAAVAVEGEASGGDVAEAVDASPSAAIAPYLAAVQGVGEGRQRRRRQYGTYGDDIEEEAEGFEEPADEAEYRHLYDARGVVDKWLGDPALWGMLSGHDVKEEAEGFEENADEAEYCHLYDARYCRLVRKLEASLRWCTRSCHAPQPPCTLPSFSATIRAYNPCLPSMLNFCAVPLCAVPLCAVPLCAVPLCAVPLCAVSLLHSPRILQRMH
ncbi:unnamed protein product [Closterium sp. NIES-54]